MEKGQYFSLFVESSEIEATEKLIDEYGMSLSEFYELAFDRGRKALAQELVGNEVYVIDGITEEMTLLSDVRGLDVTDPEPPPSNIIYLREFRDSRK